MYMGKCSRLNLNAKVFMGLVSIAMDFALESPIESGEPRTSS